MPAGNWRFGAMATCLRRNEMEIKDITLDSVVANGNAATFAKPPGRYGQV